jgi:hypothetical protein
MGDALPIPRCPSDRAEAQPLATVASTLAEVAAKPVRPVPDDRVLARMIGVAGLLGLALWIGAIAMLL